MSQRRRQHSGRVLAAAAPHITCRPAHATFPPLSAQVAREGTKKTVFTNFMELCKAMNRNQEHVSAYLLAELGTSGSLDGQQRLVVKGELPERAWLRAFVARGWEACRQECGAPGLQFRVLPLPCCAYHFLL